MFKENRFIFEVLREEPGRPKVSSPEVLTDARLAQVDVYTRRKFAGDVVEDGKKYDRGKVEKEVEDPNNKITVTTDIPVEMKTVGGVAAKVILRKRADRRGAEIVSFDSLNHNFLLEVHPAYDKVEILDTNKVWDVVIVGDLKKDRIADRLSTQLKETGARLSSQDIFCNPNFKIEVWFFNVDGWIYKYDNGGFSKYKEVKGFDDAKKDGWSVVQDVVDDGGRKGFALYVDCNTGLQNFPDYKYGISSNTGHVSGIQSVKSEDFDSALDRALIFLNSGATFAKQDYFYWVKADELAKHGKLDIGKAVKVDSGFYENFRKSNWDAVGRDGSLETHLNHRNELIRWLQRNPARGDWER